MALLRINVEPAPYVRPLINIGATLDIPTGFYLEGLYGDHILNGGLGATTAVVGIGNNFKSTVNNYMMLSACDRIFQSVPDTSMFTYDTENNIHQNRLTKFASRFTSFKDIDVIKEGIWTVTDKTKYPGAEKVQEIIKEFWQFKRDNAKDITFETPFLDGNRKPITILLPTFGCIDSFSDFQTSNILKIMDENELGDSGNNAIHMRQGLAKTQFLIETNNTAPAVSHYVLLTAQVGKAPQMQQGPGPQIPVKKLQYLKNGDVIKGVTDKFFFYMSNAWHAYNAAPIMNDATKTPLYPKNSEDNEVGDTDLNIVRITQLRGKAGPTGYTLEIIVSQKEGVLPSLTEFHYIKNYNYYGLIGNKQNYALALLPDVKLSRTTVRGKLDTNPILARAMNITSEMAQLREYYKFDSDILCSPEQLRTDIEALGYDWNELLNTRSWWTVNHYDFPLPALSTWDLLMMRLGRYHPYWMDENKKRLPKYNRYLTPQ